MSIATAVRSVDDHNLRVEVAGGAVEGRLSQAGAAMFKGIPYATPPTGSLRFKRPRPHPGWTGFRLADEANAARQSISTSYPGIGIFMVPLRQSEDCLQLHVWAPPDALRDGRKRPVLVYIHGGGNVTNAGSNPLYDGSCFALDGNLIVVTINYRLSVLGWTHFGLVSDALDEAVNLGFYDQVAALAWLRDNIAAFGGDPDEVTVVGESTGASAVTCLMVSPLARGLFKRAVIQSLSFFSTWCTQERDEAREMAERSLAVLGLKPGEAAKVLDLPFETLFRIQGKVHAGVFDHNCVARPMGGCVDAASIPDLPQRLLTRGRPFEGPVMLGWAKDEWKFIGGFSPPYTVIDRATTERLIGEVIGTERAAGFYDSYARLIGTDDPWEVSHAVMSFEQFKLAMHAVAEALAAGGGAVHAYQFSWDVPGLGGRFGAPHGADNALIFDNWRVWTDVPMMEGVDLAAVRPVTDAMHGAWIAFAKGGDPNHAKLSDWPAYGADRRVMRFADESRAVPGLLDDQRALWAKAGIGSLDDLVAAFARQPR